MQGFFIVNLQTQANQIAHCRLLRLYTTFNEARIACHDRAIILGATNKRLGALVEDHLVAAGCFIRNPAIRRSLADRLRFETQKTLAFLADVLALDHYSEARVKDQIISVGEKLGCLLMCGVLEDTVSPHSLGLLPCPVFALPY